MGTFSWALVTFTLLSIPIAAFYDSWNMQPDRFKHRSENWMRDLKNNPWHAPLDPHADTTKWPSLILVGSIVWILMLVVAIGQWIHALQ